MFSDLPHCPRQQVVMRKTHEAPNVTKTIAHANEHAEVLPSTKSVDISGVDRHRFFYRFVNLVKGCTSCLKLVILYCDLDTSILIRYSEFSLRKYNSGEDRSRLTRCVLKLQDDIETLAILKMCCMSVILCQKSKSFSGWLKHVAYFYAITLLLATNTYKTYFFSYKLFVETMGVS